MTERPKEHALIEKYDAKLSYYSPANAREMPKIMKLVEAPVSGTFLDIGCGDGRAAQWTEARRMSYVGVDYSKKRIEHARSLQGDIGTFIAADIYEWLPTLKKTKFDVIWCCELLEHLEDPCRIWNEMQRLVSDTGMVICTCPVNMPHPHHLQVFETDADLRAVFPRIVDIYRVHCLTPGGKQREHFVFTYEK